MNSKYYKVTTLLLSIIAILLAMNILAKPQQGQFVLPENINLIPDIPYAETDNPRQMLDLMLPKEPASKPLPVIVFIHGGGWRGGSKHNGVRKISEAVATGNYAGVSINYRLSSESKWPAQIHDCKAAVRWVRANAEKYNLDPEKIGIWGSSAGGHLVAMLGTSADVIAMDGSLGSNFALSSAVTCVVNFFGPADLTTIEKDAGEGAVMRYNAPDSPMSLLLGYTAASNPEGAAAASPITYITQDDPPFLLVHGTKDPVIPYVQSVTFNAVLKKAGINSILLSVTGGGHGKGFGEDVNQSVFRFFDHHLRNIKTEWTDSTIDATQRQ